MVKNNRDLLSQSSGGYKPPICWPARSRALEKNQVLASHSCPRLPLQFWVGGTSLASLALSPHCLVLCVTVPSPLLPGTSLSFLSCKDICDGLQGQQEKCREMSSFESPYLNHLCKDLSSNKVPFTGSRALTWISSGGRGTFSQAVCTKKCGSEVAERGRQRRVSWDHSGDHFLHGHQGQLCLVLFWEMGSCEKCHFKEGFSGLKNKAGHQCGDKIGVLESIFGDTEFTWKRSSVAQDMGAQCGGA